MPCGERVLGRAHGQRGPLRSAPAAPPGPGPGPARPTPARSGAARWVARGLKIPTARRDPCGWGGDGAGNASDGKHGRDGAGAARSDPQRCPHPPQLPHPGLPDPGRERGRRNGSQAPVSHLSGRTFGVWQSGPFHRSRGFLGVWGAWDAWTCGPTKPSGECWQRIKASGSFYHLFTLFFPGSACVICGPVLRIIAHSHLLEYLPMHLLEMEPLLYPAGRYFLFSQSFSSAAAALLSSRAVGTAGHSEQVDTKQHLWAGCCCVTCILHPSPAVTLSRLPAAVQALTSCSIPSPRALCIGQVHPSPLPQQRSCCQLRQRFPSS
ncbi:uncharacterized protein GJ701_012119 [Geothlypis trichas]